MPVPSMRTVAAVIATAVFTLLLLTGLFGVVVIPMLGIILYIGLSSWVAYRRVVPVGDGELVVSTRAGREKGSVDLNQPFDVVCVHNDGEWALYKATQNRRVVRFVLRRTAADSERIARALKTRCPLDSLAVQFLAVTRLRLTMREVIALLWLALILCGCVAVLFPLSERWNWFIAAVGVMVMAQALGHLAISQHLSRSRRWLRLSFWRAYRLMMLAYLLSGVFVMIGALVSLDRAFGLIVAFGAFCWVWGWGCLLVQFGRYEEPAPPDGSG